MPTRFLLPALLSSVALAVPTAPVQPLIQLDQFGYLPDFRKIGVLADPQTCYDSALWFGDDTVFNSALTSPNGPAPGFVTGGVNLTFAPDGSYSGPLLAPPLNQPVLKSYRDWNTSFPQNSWQISEPAIYYQAAYLRLIAASSRPLSYAAWAGGHGLTGAATADPDGDGLTQLHEYAIDSDPNLPGPAPTFTLSPARQLAWRMANGRPDLTTALNSSTTPTDWQPLAPTSVSSLPADDFRSAIFSAPANDPVRFYRLHITRRP